MTAFFPSVFGLVGTFFACLGLVASPRQFLPNSAALALDCSLIYQAIREEGGLSPGEASEARKGRLSWQILGCRTMRQDCLLLRKVYQMQSSIRASSPRSPFTRNNW